MCSSRSAVEVDMVGPNIGSRQSIYTLLNDMTTGEFRATLRGPPRRPCVVTGPADRWC